MVEQVEAALTSSCDQIKITTILYNNKAGKATND